jgi:hypothetical protein
MADVTCGRMGCSSLVGKAEQQAAASGDALNSPSSIAANDVA